MYNTEKFIEKSRNIHGEKYDYSLVKYKNSKTKVEIICKDHGIFNQSPVDHLRGRGCRKCAGNVKITLYEFIKKSNELFNFKYDYSLIKKINSVKDRVFIICPIHGQFIQSVENHLNFHHCKLCSYEKYKFNTILFIEKCKVVHGEKYDYSKTNYINSKTKVEIICKDHGIFNQLPSFHLRGQGCRKCSDIEKCLTLYNFISMSHKIHKYEYDYSLCKYVNNYTPVKIICKKHGIFEQIPNFHLLGQGCPNCKHSRNEKIISNFLLENNIQFEPQKTFNNCKNVLKLKFDFYLPKYNLCLEYNGKQHYKPIEFFGGQKTLEYTQSNDEIKKFYCEKNNIKYETISYLEDIKNKLKIILNI